jgi:hypothetical protein
MTVEGAIGFRCSVEDSGSALDVRDMMEQYRFLKDIVFPWYNLLAAIGPIDIRIALPGHRLCRHRPPALVGRAVMAH